MKLYLYYWDRTIYDRDSSADYFIFCLKKGGIYKWKIMKKK